MQTRLDMEIGTRQPTVLTVPGLNGAGPGHWQTLWTASRDDTVQVDLGMSSTPHRNSWVTKLDQAIRTAQAPVVLAAHSLGVLTVAWWAALSGQPWSWPVAGALLVAPPDPDRADAREEIKRFGPSPRVCLPFPSIVVASEDDPYASPQRAFDMARDWGSHFVNVGACGHINATSGVGWWHEGQELLERLIGVGAGPGQRHAPGDLQARLQIALPLQH